MSDDLKVDWGAAIQMTGKRPPWLEDGIPMRWSAGGNPYLDVKSHECVNWGTDYPVSIRLPADHSYYRQVAEPKGLTTNETLSDDLAKRMEALVRRMANEQAVCGFAWQDEARAIVALLPEPVDADALEAERIAYELDGGLPRDLVLAGLKAGRALERDSREG